MISRRIWPCAVLILLALSGCNEKDFKAQPPNPNVVASYDSGVITKDQLKEKMDSLMPCCVGRYEGDEGARDLVKEMVLPQVISRAIKEKKIDFRENIREKMGGLTNELNISFLHMKFHEQILNANAAYQDLKEDYDYQLRIIKGLPLSERFNRLTQVHNKIHKRISREVEDVAADYIRTLKREAAITKNYDVLKIKVSEEELLDFYRRHKEGFHGEEYRIPEKVRILDAGFEMDQGADGVVEDGRTARERAESALTEIRSGAGFRTVAEAYSSSAERPIEPRWHAKGNRDQSFDEVVFSLDEGEISTVFKSGESFHIVKAIEKQEGRLKTLEEIRDQIAREYRWQKGETYLEENRDRILFTINGKPYTIGDFIREYKREIPSHECHHMEKTGKEAKGEKPPQQCDFAHNDYEEQKRLVDQMVERELIIEDTYSRMIHVEHQKEIEFLTMASLYPLFHKEEMANLIHVTDEMVEDYYEKHKESYKYPAKAKISMIVIKGGEKEEDRKRASEKARMAYRELKPPLFSFEKRKNFEDVAGKYSDDPETASSGGRLEVDVHECRDAVEYMLFHGFHKKIFDLKQGEISDIFEFGGNYYIVQIREMETREQIEFQEIKDQVKEELMGEEHEKVMENWEDGLLESAGFVVYDKPLQEVLAERTNADDSEVKGS